MITSLPSGIEEYLTAIRLEFYAAGGEWMRAVKFLARIFCSNPKRLQTYLDTAKMQNKPQLYQVQKADFVMGTDPLVVPHDNGCGFTRWRRQPASNLIPVFHAQQPRGFADGVEAAIHVNRGD